MPQPTPTVLALSLLSLLSTAPALAQTAPLTSETGEVETPGPKPAPPALPSWESMFTGLPNQLATGLRFAEGPLVLRDADGQASALLICDLGAGALFRVSPMAIADQPHEAKKWLEASGAAAGAALDAEGHLLLARFSGDIARSVQPVSAAADAAAPELSPLVASALPHAAATEASDQASDQASDKPADASTAIKLGRCNDLVVLPWGDIAFTDFGSRDKAAPSKGLFLLRREAGAEEQATCVDPEFKAANGLAFDAARGVLYVADYGAAQIIAYDLSDANRTPTNRRIFAGLADARRQHKLQGMVDGMKVDPATGNLLTTGPGGIWVLSPDGERLALLPVEGASNLAIDGKVVYITAGTGVWRAELK